MTNSEIAQAFDLLRKNHLRLGVSWHIGHDVYGLTGWVFHSFQRLEGSHSGDGRKALVEVCALADRLGVDLQLWTVYPKLFAYYESFGFRVYNIVGHTHFYNRIAQPFAVAA